MSHNGQVLVYTVLLFITTNTIHVFTSKCVHLTEFLVSSFKAAQKLKITYQKLVQLGTNMCSGREA